MSLKFRTKLTIFIGAILVAVQLVNTISVYTSTRRNAIEQGRQQLTFARNILLRQLDDLTSQFVEGARVVTLDFGFREAIAVGDAATQRSVIRNLKDRLSADRVLLISLDDEILYDTLENSISPIFPFVSMLDVADEEGRAVAIAALNDTLYRLVIVPVLAPEPIAWIGIGLEINDGLAERLQRQAPIPSEISFAFQSHKSWHLAASTLTKDDRSALATAVPTLAKSAEPDIVDLGQTPYILLASPIEMVNEKSGAAVFLQYSAEEAISQTYPLLLSMIVLLVGGLGLALVGGAMLAGSVSRPLRELVDATARVGKGDYERAINLKGNDEFGTLSSTFNDMMTGIRAREEKISYQARYDALTGLLNRTEFVAALSRHLKAEKEDRHIAVVVLGVERLSETNSTLGYETGDALIREIANRLSATASPNSFLARLSGDTFGLAFDRSPKEDAQAIVEHLEADFEDPVPIQGFVLSVDLNYGLSFHDGAGGDGETLIHQAEVAEFKTHGNSQNWHVYDPDSDEVNPDQLLLITEMRRASAEHQFEMFYQPKIDLRTERLVAVESLIRWNHPERGMVSPGLFIPLAEQTGDVRQITQWALTRALQDGRSLRRDHADLQVAINLSALDLGNRDLPDQVAAALTEAELPPSALILEITESSLMSEPAVARNTLAMLDEMGIALSVDDYGTGYSSLAYLKELPVSELKIDQAFVKDMATNPEDELIVRSTVDLGHNLGLKVTAEGIEDAESFLRLQRMGCDVGQGYHIAKPMRLKNLVGFLENWAIEIGKADVPLVQRRQG
ncbi:MAG: EAL domain-containing protein [Rhodospirillaceae bacterium]|nr:EAL domain-containing protein [Rhodospirillaceae bacterium]